MKKNIIKISAFCVAFSFNSCGENEKKEVNELEKNMSIEEGITAVENDYSKGEAIFTDKGCVACHQADEKVIGPSIKDIAVAYGDNLEGLKSFLREEGEAIVDPTQYTTMQVNLAITKSMNDEDLTSLSEYILSL